MSDGTNYFNEMLNLFNDINTRGGYTLEDTKAIIAKDDDLMRYLQNAAKITALAVLLIDKGIITLDEYTDTTERTLVELIDKSAVEVQKKLNDELSKAKKEWSE